MFSVAVSSSQKTKRIVRLALAQLLLLLSCKAVSAQAGTHFDPPHRWTVLTEYAWTSGHYFPNGGDAWDRKWVAAGIGSEWRLGRFWGGALKYEAEFRPLVLISNLAQSGPGVGQTHLDIQQCPEQPGYTGVVCRPEWVYGQQFSPVGFQENFGVRRRFQPFLAANTGYLYSDHQVPSDTSGNFHFTIAVGGGFEYFTGPSGRSVSVEAQAQHYSNAYTAPTNYGTDNIFIKVSYRFAWEHSSRSH
jgi:hypothetical protein